MSVISRAARNLLRGRAPRIAGSSRRANPPHAPFPTLLSAADLYYDPLMRSASRRYVPCLGVFADKSDPPRGAYAGRVAGFLAREFPRESYDFYLCGRREMIRDVILLVDDRFPGSNVYSEIFF